MSNQEDDADEVALALLTYYSLRLFAPWIIEQIKAGRAAQIPWQNLLPRDPDDLEAEVERQREGKPS